MMKIDIVTFSCNSSPMYYEFWNPISKFWKEKFGIHPVLLYCGDENIPLSEEHGTVYRHKAIEGIADYLSATWGRFWITKMYPNKVCLTGDIDMIPLSKQFFIESLKQYTDEDSYLHINADSYYPGNFDAWKTAYNNVIAHDHVAKGKIFQKVYSFEDTFEQEMIKYSSVDYSNVTKYAFHPEEHLRHASCDNGGKWCHDELYSTEKMRQYYLSGGKVETGLSIPRHRRLDRSNWSYRPIDVVSEFYIDSHLIRPYSQYKDHIDFLMSLVP